MSKQDKRYGRVRSLKDRDTASTAALQRRLEEREIADLIPEVVNPERRERASSSLREFLLTYFPEIFYLQFSPIHEDVIKKIEDTINNGELYALAMPRGSGKTSICQCALIWAILTGRSKCSVLVCANATRAKQLVAEITALLSGTERLVEDFPREIYPFYGTASTPRRLKTLTYNDEPLYGNVTAGEIIFPKVPGSQCSESALFGVGLTGAGMRGLGHATTDGRKLRPDFVLCDDPQDRESASSIEQVRTRERLIKADMLGMAGAGRQLSCLITCTVIEPEDLADKLLDRRENPEFHGQRYQLISGMPRNMGLWEQWNTLRQDELRNDLDHSQSTLFYQNNKIKMNEGVECQWVSRYDPCDVDALTYAMRLYFRDKYSFFSEYQNAPVGRQEAFLASSITPEKCSAKLNGLAPGEIECDDTVLTAFIDVHQTLLYYTVIAWKAGFSGHIIDYGTFPEQQRMDFNHKTPPTPMLKYFPNDSLEDAISKAVNRLATTLMSKEYFTKDNVGLRVNRLLIDANWGQQTDTVYRAIKALKNPNVMPAHGVFVGAKSRNFGQGYATRGDLIGTGWRIPGKQTRLGMRYTLTDTNFWKSFFMRRLIAESGVNSSISLFGDKNTDHSKFIDHLTAEYFDEVECNGKRVEEWTMKPGRSDNHWFDCCIGCCVAASQMGICLESDKRVVTRQNAFRRFLRERYN